MEHSRQMQALSARIDELERERSDGKRETRLLVALQEAFTKIAVTRTPNDAVMEMLHATDNPLGFSRAVYFSVDHEGRPSAELEIDGGVVEVCGKDPILQPGSAIDSILRGGRRKDFGLARELCAPLIDVRRWYVLSALVQDQIVLGILYADGHSAPTPRDSEIELVHALTTIASVAMNNNFLLLKTRELATRDPLTGLYNRRAFEERLLAEMEASRRHTKSLTYVIIDVDDFKRINDVHGHAYGDSVLKTLAAALLQNSRPEDVVCRYAGDESWRY